MRISKIFFISVLLIFAVTNCKKANELSMKVLLSQTIWTYDYQESDYNDATVQLAIDLANDILEDATVAYNINGSFSKIIRPPGEVPTTVSGTWVIDSEEETLTHTIDSRQTVFDIITLDEYDLILDRRSTSHDNTPYVVREYWYSY